MNEHSFKVLEYHELLALIAGYTQSQLGADIVQNIRPQTQLNGSNGDYASTGNDMEFERIRQEDIMGIAERLRDYDDAYLQVIEELSPLFSPLFTANVNAW